MSMSYKLWINLSLAYAAIICSRSRKTKRLTLPQTPGYPPNALRLHISFVFRYRPIPILSTIRTAPSMLTQCQFSHSLSVFSTENRDGPPPVWRFPPWYKCWTASPVHIFVMQKRIKFPQFINWNIVFLGVSCLLPAAAKSYKAVGFSFPE